MAESPLEAVADVAEHIKYFSIPSSWVYHEDVRLDATSYSPEGYAAHKILTASPYEIKEYASFVGRIYHPTENQPRSNFKRIWVRPSEGLPFLTGKQLLFFRPIPEKHVSLKMPKLPELRPESGTILITRSGTVGEPVLVGDWLTEFAITDDAIRVHQGNTPIGFAYTYLLSPIAQALLATGEYGKVVSHIEAKHVGNIPTPDIPEPEKLRIHDGAVKALSLRDEANRKLDRADLALHELLGLSPFDESDIEYLGGPSAPHAFTINSAELGSRLDATQHVPVARSVVHKLLKGRFNVVRLGAVCAHVLIPPRFKRMYVSSQHGIPYLLPSQLPTTRFHGLKSLARRQAEQSPAYLLQEGQVLVTTDGTVGRVHPVTHGMAGWFGSNNMARLWDDGLHPGFLYAYLSTPYGQHQLIKDIYGGVVDHLEESHIRDVWMPEVPYDKQRDIGEIVIEAFHQKDEANCLEAAALDRLHELLGFTDLNEAGGNGAA